jgi:hypothetical protein
VAVVTGTLCDMSARRPLLALLLVLPAAVGCGADGDLASAMEAVCDDGTVELTEDPAPGEADVLREATCTAGDVELEGRTQTGDPAEDLVAQSDGVASGDGSTLYWAWAEDDGEHTVVTFSRVSDGEGDGDPDAVLAPLEERGFTVGGANDPIER